MIGMLKITKFLNFMVFKGEIKKPLYLQRLF